MSTVLCVQCYVYSVMCTVLCVQCYVYSVIATSIYLGGTTVPTHHTHTSLHHSGLYPILYTCTGAVEQFANHHTHTEPHVHRDLWLTLVTITCRSACVPNQDVGHGLVAVPGQMPGGRRPTIDKNKYSSILFSLMHITIIYKKAF